VIPFYWDVTSRGKCDADVSGQDSVLVFKGHLAIADLSTLVDEGNTLLRNVGVKSPVDAASYLRMAESSTEPLREPQNSHNCCEDPSAVIGCKCSEVSRCSKLFCRTFSQISSGHHPRRCRVRLRRFGDCPCSNVRDVTGKAKTSWGVIAVT